MDSNQQVEIKKMYDEDQMVAGKKAKIGAKALVMSVSRQASKKLYPLPRRTDSWRE